MGVAVVTIKLMPESPDVDLKTVQEQATKLIDAFTGKEAEKKISEEPVAFGLVALNIIFVMNEDLGSPDAVCDKIVEIDGVQSAEVTDVRRALG